MKTNRRATQGILLIVLGSIFLLDNLNLFPDMPAFLFNWENLFLLLAVINLVSNKLRHALTLVIVWGFFAVNRYYPLDLHQYWPLILIVIGLTFLLRKKSCGTDSDDAAFFDEVNIFGGSKKQYTSKQLQGGRSTNIFGGSTIDLREAVPVDGATLDVTSIFGGCKIVVPANWHVSVNMTSVFGGFEDKRQHTGERSPFTVYIKGFTLFGGGELKSTD